MSIVTTFGPFPISYQEMERDGWLSARVVFCGWDLMFHANWKAIGYSLTLFFSYLIRLLHFILD